MKKLSLLLFSFEPQLSIVRQALKGCGLGVFLVGGALRDHYLNRRGTDLDFAVEKNAILLARRLSRRIKGAFVLLDRDHGSARVVKRIDGEIWTFDLTDWRGASIAEDLNLRDFTVNTFAMDILEEAADANILEVKGSRRDIKARVVRMVKVGVFKEDPLRLLRAYSLQATHGFSLDLSTAKQMVKDIHLIRTVAAERIRDEIFKVLASPRAFEIVSSMDKIGLLSQVLPQLTVMVDVHQGGYHHLDVWRHSLEVLAQMERIVEGLSVNDRMKNYLQETIGGGHTRLSLLKMSALVHDIGKPETQRQEEGRMTFHGHEHAGERITRQLARHLKLSVKERYFLEDAVRMHLRPGYLSNFKRPSEKAIFRYLRDAGDEAVSLAILALADQAATRGPLTTEDKVQHHAKTCHMLIERYFKLKDQKPKQRLLTGNDLIKTLKLKPSKLFGEILSKIEESAALGKINTKNEALKLARYMVKDL